MGVRDLWQALEPVATKVHLDELRGQTVAVDLSGWIVESQRMQAAHTLKHMYLKNLFYRCSKLLSHGIKLVFVLEGKAPDVKAEVLLQRQHGVFCDGRRTTGNRPRLRALSRECERLLGILGLQCVQGTGEAEATCAHLNRNDLVDACMTEDGDAFLYGAKVVYRSVEISDRDPHVMAYRMKDIESKLGLTRRRLIALALLIGCDYYPGVRGVGKETAIKLIEKLGDVDVLDRFRSWNTDDKFADLQAKADDVIRKPRHCATCHHPGSPQKHAVNGCDNCKTEKDCRERPEREVECPCRWHEIDSVRQQWKTELEIRKKAVATKGFPPEEVIREFLKETDDVVSPSSDWKMPILSDFKDFMQENLFWEASKCAEKLLPLLARWHLLHKDSLRGNTLLKPEKIIKLRNRNNVALYEVGWSLDSVLTELEDNADAVPLRTVEPQRLFKECYPELVDRFLEELDAKKTSKKIKDSEDIRGFFKVKAKAQEPTAPPLVSEKDEPETEGNRLPAKGEGKKVSGRRAKPKTAGETKPTTRARKPRAKATPESAVAITEFFPSCDPTEDEKKSEKDSSVEDSFLAAYDKPLGERIRTGATKSKLDCETKAQPTVDLSSLEISSSPSPEKVSRTPERLSREEILAGNDCSPPKRKHVSPPSATRACDLLSPEAEASGDHCLETPEDRKMTSIRKPVRRLFPSEPETPVLESSTGTKGAETPSAPLSVTQSTPVCHVISQSIDNDYDASKSLFTSLMSNDSLGRQQTNAESHSVIVISDED